MNINLANNPFVLPPKNIQFTEISSVGLSNQAKPNASLAQSADSQKTIPQPEQSNRLFSLRPRQSQQSSNLQSRDASRQTTNPSISQYLQTESLERRDEIESLVGVDVFV